MNGGVPGDYNARYGMDFVPMIWNGSFNTADVESRIRANPQAKYLLVMNEPSLTSDVGGSNITPNQAADIWPRYEQVARGHRCKNCRAAGHLGYHDRLQRTRWCGWTLFTRPTGAEMATATHRLITSLFTGTTTGCPLSSTVSKNMASPSG